MAAPAAGRVSLRLGRDADMDDWDVSSVQSSSDDEEQELDTTAEQRAAGKDIQGIPWERLHFTREQYRVRLLPRLRHP